MNSATPALFIIASDDDEHAQHLRDIVSSLEGRPLCIRVHDPSEARDILRSFRTHDPSPRGLPCMALLAFQATAASAELLCWMHEHPALRPARTVVLTRDRHAATHARLAHWGADAVLAHFPSADQLANAVVPQPMQPVGAMAAWASAGSGRQVASASAADCCTL